MRFTKYHIELALANGAGLSGADLSGADLSGADLSGADLSGANLYHADLYDADLYHANLSGADLSGADLYDADLYHANLSGADLSGADLSRSVGLEYAQCAFAGHGECGRTLTAVKIDGEIVLWCGCFIGSPDDLSKYIEDGADEYKESRTLAMEFVLKAIEVKRA